MSRLENKTAVVTGATTGIGLAIAQRLAAEGAYVFLTGRRKQQLDEAVESIGAQAAGIQADSANLEDLERLFASIGATGRRVDVVVANAADSSTARLDETTVEHVNQVVDTNFKGTLFTVQKSLPLLNDGASIILLGSAAGEGGTEGLGVYGATKAAIRAFARTWANELKGQGIRVNTISPGAVDTPGLAASLPGLIDQLRTGSGGAIPLGRIAHPDEIASVAAFLACSDSSYITGTNIYVDGGKRQI
jgi:NAD(P)-dependent dehydrogenase (short-subunit alcohol dehydrogenase family)